LVMARAPVTNTSASFIWRSPCCSPAKAGAQTRVALGRLRRTRPLPSQGYSLIHHLVRRDAPDVERADVSVLLPDLDPAPAVAALADAADDAMLDEITHLGAV